MSRARARARDELKRRRQQLGLTQEAAAAALGVALSTYKCWEQGLRTPLVGYRPRIARVFHASLVEVQRWFDTSTPAPTGVDVPAWLGTFAALEQGAAELWAYEPVSMPGLLQTADYAAAVQRQRIVPPSGEEVDRWVGYRLARQEVLSREPEPLRLSAVLDESVLHRVAGDGEVMAEQLDHLATQAARPTIDVRILPLDRGTHIAAFGSFTVLTSCGASSPYMAVVLDRCGAHYLDRGHEVDGHAELFKHLQDVALSPTESIDLIHAVAKERYTP
jgi:transcriptional regulator with XRE-family HTH domain